MYRSDLADSLASLNSLTPLMTAAMFGFFSIGALVIGTYMYIRAGVDQRDQEAKETSIRTGEVQPETLSVVRKYINSSRHHTSGYPHVILRGSHQPEINYSSTREFYDSVDVGGTAMGYYFPDGYYIPTATGHDAGLAKWVFLCSGLATGSVCGVIALWNVRFRLVREDRTSLAGEGGSGNELPRCHVEALGTASFDLLTAATGGFHELVQALSSRGT